MAENDSKEQYKDAIDGVVMLKLGITVHEFLIHASTDDIFFYSGGENGTEKNDRLDVNRESQISRCLNYFDETRRKDYAL